MYESLKLFGQPHRLFNISFNAQQMYCYVYLGFAMKSDDSHTSSYNRFVRCDCQNSSWVEIVILSLLGMFLLEGELNRSDGSCTNEWIIVERIRNEIALYNGLHANSYDPNPLTITSILPISLKNVIYDLREERKIKAHEIKISRRKSTINWNAATMICGITLLAI